MPTHPKMNAEIFENSHSSRVMYSRVCVCARVVNLTLAKLYLENVVRNYACGSPRGTTLSAWDGLQSVVILKRTSPFP